MSCKPAVKLILAPVLLIIAIGYVPLTFAQAKLEEIVVLARKKEESLQSVPLSVTAFSESGIENRGIENSADIGNFISNVQFDTSSQFAGTSTFNAYIRGIGQSDFAINTDPAVGVYVDGVYYARTAGAVLELLDVERIEVLKGPQGTLFGRNTIGGVVNVITRQPSDDPSFEVNATVGDFSRADINLAASFPLSESVFSSIAVAKNTRDGYQKRIPFPGDTQALTGRLDQTLVTSENSSEDLGAVDTTLFRGKLVFEASDNVNITVAADYTDSDTSASAFSLLDAEAGINDPGSLLPLFNLCVAGVPAPPCLTSPRVAEETLPFDNRFLTGDIDTTFATGANFSKSEDYGASLTVDWAINDSLSLKSITAYREIDQAFGVDIDSSPAVYDQTTFTITQDQFSQELQLNGESGKLSYTLGAYYFTEDAFQEDNVPIAGGLIQVAGGNGQEVESISLFGELNYAITDAVNLVFGARRTSEDKDLILDQRSLNPDFFLSVGFPQVAFPREDLTFLGPDGVQSASFDNTSVRAGVNWQVNDNLFTYATFSQGFKSGGFTTRLTAPFDPGFGAATGGLTRLDFGEETVDSFELGFKADFLDNRLRLNAAAFFNSYDDIQIVVQRGVTPANENAGEAEIKGVEFELEALASDNVSIIATLGFIDAEYTDVDPLAAPITTDFELPNTPDTTASVALNWILPEIVNGQTALNLNWSHTGDVFNDSVNTPLLFQDSSDIFNASLYWTSPNEKWDVRLGVNNLSDERRIVSGFNSGALSFVGATYNRPREWYLSVGYSY